MIKKDLTKYISAMLLGDGTIQYTHSKADNTNRNARYSLSQIEIHRDYVEWQASILEKLTKVSIYEKEAWSDKNGGNHQKQLQLKTLTHPLYTTLRNRFYLCGKKVVSPHDLTLFDWESAAIWMMDDGSLEVKNRVHKEYYYRVTLATNCFSFSDASLLQKVLYEKLSIPFNIQKTKNKAGEYHPTLRTSKDNAKKFLEGITPYILPSFQYKVRLSND